ncbi:TPA: transporter substrate-binding domain-containing protein [Klebsiella pneumoniae]|uniref:lysine/arginine/ornithine ABC transporter substrate-binding protein n=1 Tax=Klebsiella pneumoniae TaxID=573 RepID=UPI000E2E048C|nr:lysine/arginine/ornithine ABC transporter substrate-binding protein [Klebsiella pneumoniae]HDT4844480.1 transporter substrate-binding domain-containing protein [Klebsiella pneumoniae subsp. pneumoniae]MCD8728376.1 lysine/arginine/ornithine ABC transporter substrate-binding protein [Klebsiella pneumoniae]MDS0175165.1 lysine/arginine/ornithine ABC transporter substrate-binding protein [Klebsiella pneumoniae]WLW87564.1 lysine/arginine/ornithine ABC transporter substrate-binding protein [Klebsie
MKVRGIALSVLLTLGVTHALHAEVPQNIRLGTEPAYAPFESKNAQGEVVGFDIDLAKELCRRIKANCTIVQTEFDALIPSLKARKIDAIIAALSITPKRLKEIDFTDKLYSANARLIAPKGSKIQPDLASLQGKSIGVQQGTIQEVYANRYWSPKGVNVVAYQAQDQVYADLTAGRLDAGFQDETAGSYGFLKQDAGKAYEFAGPAVKDNEIFGVGTGIGLRKGDKALQDAFNSALAEMLKDGTYQKIASRYFDFDIYGK